MFLKEKDKIHLVHILHSKTDHCDGGRTCRCSQAPRMSLHTYETSHMADKEDGSARPESQGCDSKVLGSGKNDNGNDDDNENDNDTLTEGQPTSAGKPGPTDMSDGVITPGIKNPFKLSCLALAASVRLGHCKGQCGVA